MKTTKERRWEVEAMPKDIAAEAHIKKELGLITDLSKFEPADQVTANYIEHMVDCMLQQMVNKNMLYDYQAKSSAIVAVPGVGHIYTSVIFQTGYDAKVFHLNHLSHKQHSVVGKNTTTAFDRAMKGV